MSEFLGFFKFILIWIAVISFITKDIEFTRSKEAFAVEKQEIESAKDVVDGDGVDGLNIADVVSPSSNLPTASIQKAYNTPNKQSNSPNGFTLLIGVLVLAGLMYVVIKRQDNPQMMRRDKSNDDNDRFVQTSVRGIPCERVMDDINGEKKPAWKVGKEGEPMRQIEEGRCADLTEFDEHFIIKKLEGKTINWEIIEKIKRLWAYADTNKEIVKSVNMYGYGETNIKAITGCFVRSALAETIEDRRMG